MINILYQETSSIKSYTMYKRNAEIIMNMKTTVIFFPKFFYQQSLILGWSFCNRGLDEKKHNTLFKQQLKHIKYKPIQAITFCISTTITVTG